MPNRTTSKVCPSGTDLRRDRPTVNFMSDLQLLETVSLAYEAEHLQQVLASAGIEAFVEGLHGSNAFGMNALMGSIKIKVRPADLPRARQALSEAFNSVGREWYCGQCQETNEASFDICWQCGGERSQVEAEPPQAIAPEPVALKPEDLRSQHPVSKESSSSPYAPPLSEPVRSPQESFNEHVPAAVQSEYEDTIERGYRASILGLVTLPGILHIYSFVLLLGALSLPAQTTAKLSWRYTLAMTINLIVFLAAGWLLSYLFRQ